MTLVQLKGNKFATSDLLVLMNFVNTNRSLRENETWLPICLPKLNAQGFLNSYISFLGDSSSSKKGKSSSGSGSGSGGGGGGGGSSSGGGSTPGSGKGNSTSGGLHRQNSISLMLITTDNSIDVFHKFSESKRRIEKKLIERGIIDAIRKQERQIQFTTVDIGVPQAFHFIYVHGKSSVPQYCSTALSAAPYLDKDSQKRLLRRSVLLIFLFLLFLYYFYYFCP